jgi:hypothetical protein
VDDEWAADWPVLAAERERWRRGNPASGGTLPARLAFGAHANFASFVDFVRHGPEGASHSEPALAMAFFGPPGSPPPEVWDGYVALHRRLAASVSGRRKLNPFDLMLAFGCGWGRSVLAGARGWHGRWEAAYATMINQVRASVIATNRLLVDEFPQFELTPDDLLELPGDFTVSLLGGCDCGHHRRECGNNCGRACCFAPHALAAWDPSACHLRPFIDQAVRGTAVRRILGAAFAESLTYYALAREGRILRRRVEFKCCSRCQHLYDEATCPVPGCDGPEGDVVARTPRPNWLIHPEHEGGNYREMIRWVCGHCKNLYPIRFRLRERISDDPCPVCGWNAPPRKAPGTVTVWVRVPPGGAARGFPGGRPSAEQSDPCDAQDEEGMTDDE